MKAGVFLSEQKDSFSAGREASACAVAVSGTPVLTLAFTTDGYDQVQVLEGVKQNTSSSLIAGFCCAGVATSSGIHKQGVGVMTLSGDFRASTTLQKGLSQDPFSAGQKAGQALMKSGILKGSVIVLPDGFQANIYEMLRGIYSEMGPDFQYIGGGAGDNLHFFKTYQFTEQEVSDDALSVVTLDGLDLGVGIGHGWNPVGEPLVITRSEGKRVYEIDGSPAFSSYTKRLGQITKDQFPAIAMKHPIGFPNISGQYIIRDPLQVNEDQSIDFVTEVPSQAIGYIMEGRLENLILAAEKATQKAASAVSEHAFVLLFDCISRALFMDEQFQEEIQIIKNVIGTEIPLMGALTFGEVGCYDTAPLFHNKTTVVAVGGKRSV